MFFEWKMLPLLGFSLVLAGCRPSAPVKAPEPVRVSIPQPVVTDGSLWQPNGTSPALISDRTARKQGDIVTIVVLETVDAKRDKSTKTKRAQNVSAEVSDAVYPGYLIQGGQLPKLGMKSSRSFDGAGTIEDSGEVKTTISAQVTDVLPNGNLVLLGQKEIIVSGDTQIVTLTGIVRQDDITTQNTVRSDRIAEARISISGSGPLHDAQKRTLVGRLLDFLNLM